MLVRVDLTHAYRRATREIWRAEAARHGGSVKDVDGLSCWTTRIAQPFWNGVLVTRRPTEPVAALTAATRWMDHQGMPYGVLVPAGLEPAMAGACGAVGMGPVGFQSVMTVAPAQLRGVADPPGLQVRTAACAEEVVRIWVEAFGDPEADSLAFLGPQIGAPGLTTYVGCIEGEPVGCAQLVMASDAAAIFAVATRPGYRRLGTAGALTGVAARAAFAGGAAFVFLNPTEMARALYAGLGFRPQPGLVVWRRPSA